MLSDPVCDPIGDLLSFLAPLPAHDGVPVSRQVHLLELPMPHAWLRHLHRNRHLRQNGRPLRLRRQLASHFSRLCGHSVSNYSDWNGHRAH